MVRTRAGPVFGRRIDVSAEEVDDQGHGEDGDRIHGRGGMMKVKAGGDEGARVRRNFL